MGAKNPHAPDLKGSLDKVREDILVAARRAGRDPAGITLVGVTKGVPAERIREAYRLGLREVGENRIQEAKSKISRLPPDLSWHMVGQLQTNKAGDAAAMFSLVHSVDRVRIGEALSRAAAQAGRPCRGLIQVNMTGVEGQGGTHPADIEKTIEILARLPYLQICGLMALGPYPAEREEIRKAFRDIAGIFRRLASGMGPGFSILSLGMSEDFGIAIEEGSTLVRIGRAIFGVRRGL